MDDLKTFCEQMIRQNHISACISVLNMINVESGRLRVASDNRLSDTEMDSIIPHVFAVSKNIILKMSEKLDSTLSPVTLVSTQIAYDSNVKNNETIQFSLNKSMMLANVVFSNIFHHYPSLGNNMSSPISHPFTISIEKKLNPSSRDTKILYLKSIVINASNKEKNHVELQPPIRIQSDCIYRIMLESNINPQIIKTYKAFISDKPIELAPNICITIHPNDQKHSLISQLHFQYAEECE